MDIQPRTSVVVSIATLAILAAVAAGIIALYPQTTTREPTDTSDCDNQRVYTSIEEALVDKDTTCILNLSHQNLASLPTDIGRLSAVHHLDLSHNQLASLPPEIGWLRDIRVLNVSHNQLATLPPHIGWMRKMTTLNVSNNKLTSLPPEIGNCQEVRQFDVSHNQLRQLPPDIRWLTNLTTLNLSRNNFAPSQLDALSNIFPVAD